MNDSIDIDWERLHQVSEDDPEFELELLTMLAEDVKIHIEDLRQAVIDRDMVTINSEAHYIKGSSANVGAMGISNIAKQLEHINSEQVATDNPILLVEQMTTQLECLQAYLVTRASG